MLLGRRTGHRSSDHHRYFICSGRVWILKCSSFHVYLHASQTLIASLLPACVFGICFVMLCLILMCRLKTRRCRRNGGPNGTDHEHVVILNGVGGQFDLIRAGKLLNKRNPGKTSTTSPPSPPHRPTQYSPNEKDLSTSKTDRP